MPRMSKKIHKMICTHIKWTRTFEDFSIHRYWNHQSVNLESLRIALYKLRAELKITSTDNMNF